LAQLCEVENGPNADFQVHLGQILGLF